jgi:hypothetical protein
MTKADQMAASGQTNFDVQIEAHSLPSKAGAPVAPVPVIAAEIELQKFRITKRIQPSNQRIADLNSRFVKNKNGGPN